MKKVSFAVAITMACLFALSTIATAKSKPNEKFYEFGEQVIDGQILTPRIKPVDVKKSVEHDRLLELKKSFLSKILDSSRDRSLK